MIVGCKKDIVNKSPLRNLAHFKGKASRKGNPRQTYTNSFNLKLPATDHIKRSNTQERPRKDKDEGPKQNRVQAMKNASMISNQTPAVEPDNPKSEEYNAPIDESNIVSSRKSQKAFNHITFDSYRTSLNHNDQN